MLWIAVVIALGVLVGALIITYGYRHSMMIVLCILVALIIALVWYLRYGGEEGAGLIEPAEVELKGLAMTQQYRSSYRMTGRLVNHSQQYTVTSVDITITASDCQDGDAGCVVVGEVSRTIPVQIPPGQARDVLEQYVFQRFVIRGELQWRHSISEIQASPE
jgi:hypothetical protein